MDVWKQHGDTVPEKQCGCIELHGNNVEVQSTTEIMEGIPPHANNAEVQSTTQCESNVKTVETM